MELNDLLRYAVQVYARNSIPPEKVREIIGDTKKKQLKAYNLCDGTRTLREVAKEARIDEGNFSKTADRWVENGIAFSTTEGGERRLLHLYPLPRA